MQELKVELIDNILTAENFIRLKIATGFMEKPSEWDVRYEKMDGYLN